MDFNIGTMPLVENDGDYIKDGLLYCGKCNTRKQWKGVLLGKEQIMPCLCKCQTKARDRKKEEEKAEKQKEIIEKRRKYAFSGGKTEWEQEENPASADEMRMMKWNFKTDDNANPEMTKKAKNFVRNFDAFRAKGRGIIFYGSTGTGKTFISCCIANALIDLGYLVIVTNFSKIANELLSTYDKSDYMEKLMKCNLLIIDDLDIERQTGYMSETVYNVIDSRYRSGKPMIVTTNLSSEQLKNPGTIEKQRVYSRIMDVCIPILFAGEDRRYKNAKNKYAEDMKLLNEDVF